MKGIFILFLMTAGCASAPLMQESYFVQVTPGIKVSDIQRVYGEPYEIREMPNSFQEYVYVQRIPLGNSAVEQQEFVFTVHQGIVIGKDARRAGTCGFQLGQ